MPQWAGIHCTVVVAVLASWFKVCLSLSVTSSVGVDCRVCSAESESDRKTIFVGTVYIFEVEKAVCCCLEGT